MFLTLQPPVPMKFEEVNEISAKYPASWGLLEKKKHSVHMHALEPLIHLLDFHSVHEIYPLESIVWIDTTL